MTAMGPNTWLTAVTARAAPAPRALAPVRRHAAAPVQARQDADSCWRGGQEEVNAQFGDNKNVLRWVWHQTIAVDPASPPVQTPCRPHCVLEAARPGILTLLTQAAHPALGAGAAVGPLAHASILAVQPAHGWGREDAHKTYVT